MPASRHRVSTVMIATSLLLVCARGAAQSTPPPLVQPTVIDSAADSAMRMTVPVMIDGSGPYHFIVDTGADRSVISRALADSLGLEAAGSATLHGMVSVDRVSTVALKRLGIAGRVIPRINAPALAESNIGAQGILGIDSLKDRRIIMDFRARTLTIAEPGAREPVDPDTIVVTARSRYGQLVLVDAQIDSVPVTVIIDSGAQNTVGNTALRTLLARRHRKMRFVGTELIDVTGARLAAEVSAVDKVRIGGIELRQVFIAFADAHPFKRFGLQNRPAMLLGIDTLRSFRRVSVDFAQRKVRFLLPGDV
ncbi:aspartyl protease family protein [Sphingomonas sp.]|uniref:aspartyl protease family protein n=1 Tax=Sphingomonas sp. TaxID=28214 RepID=UPI0025E6CCA1|nr:aspartyl protease family protein [Sphingomonas sp.]